MKSGVHEISRATTGGSVPSGPAFEVDDILTHSLNPLGSAIVFFDPGTGQYYEADDLIVTDEEGNVITK